MTAETTFTSSDGSPSPDADPIHSPIAAGFQDLRTGFSQWRIWTAFAWEEIKSTYRRSVMGALWITLSFAAFVGVKLLIFTPLMRSGDSELFSVYLTLGFFVWQFISTVVAASPTVFVIAEGWIKNDQLPLSTYIYQGVAKVLYNTAFMAVVVVAVLAVLQWPLAPVALLSLVAFLVLVFNAVWVMLLLGVVCARHRDIAHLVRTIMRVMFFLTPIFWFPEQMGALFKVLWWNPFFHYLEIFRAPIVAADPAWQSWLFVGCVTALGWTAALLVFGTFRRRIVFWF